MNRKIVIVAAVLVVAGACKTTEEKTTDTSARVPPVEEFRAERPPAGPAAAINLPKFEIAKLESGLTVMVANVPQLPIVDVRLVVTAGAAQEDADKAGLASLTFDMLDEGAGDMNSIAFADAVAALGAEVSVGAGRESGSASMQILRRNLDEGVRLLALLAQKPRFSDDDFKRERKQALGGIKARNGDPRAVSAELFAEVAFGKEHPYGHPAGGTEKSVTTLTTKDVKGFWAKHAGPKTSALIFAGDITLDDAKAMAKAHFSSWKSSAVRSDPPADPEEGELKIHVVDVPETPQTVVRIGRPLIRRGDPDQWALEIMNRMLGGMFSSRLNLKLREEKQFTYGAGSALSPGRGVGPWSAGAGIKVEHTNEAIGDFFAEFSKLATEAPGQTELDAAKDNLIKSFPASFETISSMSAAASEIFLFDLEGDYFAKIPAAVAAVTVEDIKRASARALAKEDMRVVLVGDYAKFKDGLGGLSLGEVVVVER